VPATVLYGLSDRGLSKGPRGTTENKISYRVFCSTVWKVMIVGSLQIRNLWEILSGQHKTNAGDEFVNGVKAVETEWAAVLGKTLCPIFYRKMPQRLAKRLSAGFQIKESQPQVHFSILTTNDRMLESCGNDMS